MNRVFKPRFASVRKQSATLRVLHRHWWMGIVILLAVAMVVMYRMSYVPRWAFFLAVPLLGPPWFSVHVTPSGSRLIHWWFLIPFWVNRFGPGDWLPEAEDDFGGNDAPATIRHTISSKEYLVRLPGPVAAWLSEHGRRLQQMPREPHP